MKPFKRALVAPLFSIFFFFTQSLSAQDSCWSQFTPGFNGDIWAIAIDGNDVYIGGSFSSAHGVAANNIVKWDGTSFTPLGTGVAGGVFGLAIQNGDLIAGGTFANAGGVPVQRIARWDGTSWSAIGTNHVPATVYNIAVDGNEIYTGESGRVQYWNGSTWTTIGNAGGAVFAIGVDSNGDVYAGGTFSSMSGAPFTSRIAKWNGNTWSGLGQTSVNGIVEDLDIIGTDVYVGGSYGSISGAGGVNSRSMAKWNGSFWEPMGFGVAGSVFEVTTDGKNVYAGGVFSGGQGGPTSPNVIKWNGSTWEALGSGVNQRVLGLATTRNQLFVGGSFTSAGAQGTGRFASWDCGIYTAPLVFTEVKKILASDGAAGDAYGDLYSVTISGDIAIVGSRADDDNGDGSGSAYVYYRNQGGTDNWGQVKKLTSSDPAAGDRFGNVALEGDVAIIGSDLKNGSTGAAYVFYRNQGGADNWGEVKKITSSDLAAGDQFGLSISISGGFAVIGANLDDDNGDASGSAYIFQRDNGGVDNWGEVAKLTASDGAFLDFFGISVAISGENAVVGSILDDAVIGSAYIFSRNQGGPDNWGEVKKLTASDGALDDAFGNWVDISGDLAFVGSHQDDDNGDASGSVYIFSRDLGGTDNWGELKKLTPSDGDVGDLFGITLAISGETLVVGSDRDDDNGSESGSAYVFSRNLGGTDNWGQADKLTPADGATDDFFGKVAISGDQILIGANGDDDNGDGSGSAYIFGPDSNPTAQATALSIDGFTNTSINMSWTNGDGDGRVVFARKGFPVNNSLLPVDGTTYSANATFGSGDNIGPDTYVVYNGSGSSVAVSGLDPGNSYHFVVVEYNNTIPPINYLTPGNPRISQATSGVSSEPTMQASGLSFSNLMGTTASLSWANGDGANRIVIGRETNNVTSNEYPADGTGYTACSVFGSGDGIGNNAFVVFDGPGTSVNLTGLSEGKTYYFRVFEYNGSGGTADYLTVGPPSTNFTTPGTQDPTSPALGIGFSAVGNNSMTVSWTNGNGSARLVLARKTNPVSASFMVVDGSSYTANPNFGSGSNVGGNTFVVFDGVGTSVNVTGLELGTLYHFTVIEYNSPPTRYLTTGFPAGSQATTGTLPGNATNMQFSNLMSTSVTVSWANGGGDARLLVARANFPVNPSFFHPVDGQVYVADANFSNMTTHLGGQTFVVFNGGTNSVTVTGLSPSTFYGFAVFEYDEPAPGNTFYQRTGFLRSTVTSSARQGEFGNLENAESGIQIYGYDNQVIVRFLDPEQAKGTINLFDVSGQRIARVDNQLNPTAEHIILLDPKAGSRLIIVQVNSVAGKVVKRVLVE